MFKTDYFLYMAEKEGLNHLVNTRQSNLNAAIKDFLHSSNINDPYVQEEIFNKNNLYDLTDKELNYIKREVEKKYY